MNTQNHLIYTILVNGLTTTLHLLEKAENFIKENNLNESDILEASIAPDMFNFKRQIQIVSDSSKGAVAKMLQSEAPKMEDNEASISELKSRIEKTLEYVKSVKPEDFKNASDLKISFPWMPNKYLEGQEYVNKFALTNYLFHVVTAYNILRMKGVQIGKMDYLSNMEWKDLN